jgi:hypothetical protein
MYIHIEIAIVSECMEYVCYTANRNDAIENYLPQMRTRVFVRLHLQECSLEISIVTDLLVID